MFIPVLNISKYTISMSTPDLSEKLSTMKEDYQNQWWNATDKDDFNISKKLFRVGCRPLKRKYLSLMKQNDGSVIAYQQIKKIREDLDECYQLLEYLHLAKAKEDVEGNK